jgi:hypothetical protein
MPERSGALGRTRGRKPADRRDAQIAELRRRLERSEAELEKARRVIEVQGKASALLGADARYRGRERVREHRAMIEQTVEQLTPLVGTRPACRALGVSHATIYRRRRPPEPRPAKPRPAPPRALSEAEPEAVLELMHSARFVDCAPAQVYATLLDEGQYLASERTMYRLLEANGRFAVGAISSPTRLRRTGAARRALERSLVVEYQQAQGPGEVDLVLPVRDPRHLQPFCGAPQNGCSVPGFVMWLAAAEANDDGGERPGGGVFGRITPRLSSPVSAVKGVIIELALTVPSREAASSVPRAERELPCWRSATSGLRRSIASGRRGSARRSSATSSGWPSRAIAVRRCAVVCRCCSPSASSHVLAVPGPSTIYQLMSTRS